MCDRCRAPSALREQIVALTWRSKINNHTIELVLRISSVRYRKGPQRYALTSFQLAKTSGLICAYPHLYISELEGGARANNVKDMFKVMDNAMRLTASALRC